MNYRRWTAAAAVSAAIVSFSGAGMAQNRDGGFYASLTGLLVIPRDSESSGKREVRGARRDVSVELMAKSGFGVLAAAGYEMSSRLRAELELGYRGYEFDKAKVKVDPPIVPVRDKGHWVDGPVDGDFSTLSVMANGIYSFRRGKLRPYAGLGVGLARHTLNLERITYEINGRTVLGPSGGPEEDSTVLAYQAMAGIGYALSDNAEVRLGYRYFATGKADFNGDEFSYGTHNFEIGLLYRF